MSDEDSREATHASPTKTLWYCQNGAPSESASHEEVRPVAANRPLTLERNQSLLQGK
jgi:hypothetical protein